VTDDKQMRRTPSTTGPTAKREGADRALRTLVRLRKQARIRRLRSKLDWQGELKAMRSDN
jgi:hypothetical protein